MPKAQLEMLVLKVMQVPKVLPVKVLPVLRVLKAPKVLLV